MSLFTINDEQLKIIIDHIDMKDIVKDRTYKLKLKKFVEAINGDTIHLKKDIHYGRIKDIIKMFEKVINKYCDVLEVDEKVYEYINQLESYIEKKYTIGNDIRNQDERYFEKYKEFKSIVNQNMKRQLREKQMWDAFFMTFIQKSGNFSVPGSGKTSSVLGMFAYLMAMKDVKRIIMIGPKNAFKSWKDEFDVCFGENIKRVSLDLQNVKNKKIALKYDSGNANLILVNYEALEGIGNELVDLIDDKTILVFDEVHRVKNPNSIRAGYSLNIAKVAHYVVALTGTPIPNGYQDINVLLNLLYPDDYNQFFRFSMSTLKNPTEEDILNINDKIQPFYCRTNKKELNVPEPNEDIIINIFPTEAENRLFEILFNKHRKSSFELFIRLLQLESDPNMLLQTIDVEKYKKILEYTNEDIERIDYIDYSNEIKPLVKSINITSKTERTLKLINKLVEENKNVIVWCIFRKSMDNFKAYLDDAEIKSEIISGSVDSMEREEIIERFKEGSTKVLITNPHTLAESVSLHKTCHDAIYFEYSFNLVHLLQSKDRIHRLGLREDDYTQYYFMQNIFMAPDGEFSLDRRIYDRLMQKEQLMIDAIENHKLEIMPTNDEDLKWMFEILMK
ncbi:DEAD/DEAH box helicase [Macrococcus equipercicus]|uniref:DEAD/DEAH box helicase family protein n=1 Tax=Macrococcus equipercicus TaxID=69967 RepID=A0A9Q9BN49_9STAP|nr:SNF2-related protein [Macrococcus equipercicus]UTH14195.1 DEAD/DEAH box helicase family protein [Macrococcus equipercicus]